MKKLVVSLARQSSFTAEQLTGIILKNGFEIVGGKNLSAVTIKTDDPEKVTEVLKEASADIEVYPYAEMENPMRR